MDLQLKDKTALVTGAGVGIGFATDNAVGGGGPASEFAAFIAREQKIWSDIVRRAQIKAD